MRPAIILMSKVPRAGYTKTRLMERLSGRACAAFHSACLLDLAQTVEQTGLPAYLYYTGGSPWEFPSSEAMDKLIKRPQLGQDLGERMYNAALEVLTQHDYLIFIGADLPSLSLITLKEAIRQLDLFDTVVGPAEDGGYYLLGIKQAYLELFSDIDWGTPQVKEATLAKIKSIGLSVSLLETARDIDTWNDLVEFFKGSLITKQFRELQSFRFVEQILAAQSPPMTEGDSISILSPSTERIARHKDCKCINFTDNNRYGRPELYTEADMIMSQF